MITMPPHPNPLYANSRLNVRDDVSVTFSAHHHTGLQIGKRKITVSYVLLWLWHTNVKPRTVTMSLDRWESLLPSSLFICTDNTPKKMAKWLKRLLCADRTLLLPGDFVCRSRDSSREHSSSRLVQRSVGSGAGFYFPKQRLSPHGNKHARSSSFEDNSSIFEPGV